LAAAAAASIVARHMVAGGAERAYGDEYYDGAFLCVCRVLCCFEVRRVR
jgi:hypothetical protein